MKKYLTEYRIYFRNALSDDNCDLERLLAYHLKQIEFFQHERFVHLIVMVLVAICMIMSLVASFITSSIAFIILSVLLLCLLVPYISHYYFLENQTQALYDDYNELFVRLYGFGYRSCSQKKPSAPR